MLYVCFLEMNSFSLSMCHIYLKVGKNLSDFKYDKKEISVTELSGIGICVDGICCCLIYTSVC